MKIAILGWGSLIWDNRSEFANFNSQIEEWKNDGPRLKLEFSRISKSREGALTLVLDEKNGAECTVQYAMSKRRVPDDAICDLRCREGTVLRNIGYYFADDSRKGEPNVPDSIKKWIADKGFDVVIWTGLPSNFKTETEKDFSVNAAKEYLQGLSNKGKAKSVEYIMCAPDYIDTPLRRAMQTEPWFIEQKN